VLLIPVVLKPSEVLCIRQNYCMIINVSFIAEASVRIAMNVLIFFTGSLTSNDGIPVHHSFGTEFDASTKNMP